MTSTGPLVSVVMSVYNGERHIRQAIDSILRQSFVDFEFIIVNDGSTDATEAFVGSYHDDRIILVQQENKGLTKALNEGISLARGKYIARQDADDISKPDRLAKQVTYLEANRDVALLGTRFEFIDESGNVISRSMLQTENGTLQERLPKINQFCHASVMMRREAIEKIGPYREFFQYAQDYDLWLRIAECYKIANLPECLVQYRVQDTAISTNKIILQSRFACAAAKLAEQRRTTGRDDLDNGTPPNLPHFEEFSPDLQTKLTDHYCANPSQLITALGESNTTADAKAIFEKICFERQDYAHNCYSLKRDLAHYSELIESKNDSLEKKDQILNEQAQRLDLKDAELQEFQSILEAKDIDISELRKRIDDLMNSISWKATAPARKLFEKMKNTF